MNESKNEHVVFIYGDYGVPGKTHMTVDFQMDIKSNCSIPWDLFE